MMEGGQPRRKSVIHAQGVPGQCWGYQIITMYMQVPETKAAQLLLWSI
jgi:hypothetical protein